MSVGSESIKDREFNKFAIKNGRRVVNVDASSVRTTQFGEALQTGREVLFNVKANVPSVSVLRNQVSSTGGGAVSIESGEFMLSAPTGGSVKLETAERGRYLAGYEAQAGIGVRLPNQTFSGNSFFQWGYYEESVGFGFGVDSDGVYIFTRNNFIDQKIRQKDWTTDKMDGTGRSKTVLDLSEGLIFHIDYAWYGYSAVEFSIQVKSSDPEIRDYMEEVHRFSPGKKVSVEQPNLYITAELNNENDPDLESYVGGRQYSTYGIFKPQLRIASEFVINKSVSETFTPLISFRRKSQSLAQLAQAVRILNTSVASSDDLIFGYLFDGVLTGANFKTPSNMTASETALEADNSATAISGGVSIGPLEPVIGGQGSRAELGSDGSTTFDLVNDKIITLVARTVSGTGTVSVATLNMTEEW